MVAHGDGEQRRAVSEGDILRILAGLAAASRVYRLQLRDARPFPEVLSEDYSPASTLLESMAVADAEPAYLGTPRHLEQATMAALRELQGRPT